MTIREVAQLTGLTHQAIYKKIKANGLNVADLKDKNTGHFTPDGEAKIRQLFKLTDADATQVEKSTTEVDDLTTQVEKLRNQVDTLNKTIATLTEERDYLRRSLEISQQLQAATLAKIPQALPAGEKPEKRSFWQRIRGK